MNCGILDTENELRRAPHAQAWRGKGTDGPAGVKIYRAEQTPLEVVLEDRPIGTLQTCYLPAYPLVPSMYST